MYRSGDSRCFRNGIGLAVGSGGNSGECNWFGAGGGSGLLNITGIVLFANINTLVEINIATISTTLTAEESGEIKLSASNGELFSGCKTYGGMGYS